MKTLSNIFAQTEFQFKYEWGFGEPNKRILIWSLSKTYDFIKMPRKLHFWIKIWSVKSILDIFAAFLECQIEILAKVHVWSKFKVSSIFYGIIHSVRTQKLKFMTVIRTSYFIENFEYVLNEWSHGELSKKNDDFWQPETLNKKTDLR